MADIPSADKEALIKEIDQVWSEFLIMIQAKTFEVSNTEGRADLVRSCIS